MMTKEFTTSSVKVQHSQTIGLDDTEFLFSETDPNSLIAKALRRLIDETDSVFGFFIQLSGSQNSYGYYMEDIIGNEYQIYPGDLHQYFAHDLIHLARQNGFEFVKSVGNDRNWGNNAFLKVRDIESLIVTPVGKKSEINGILILASHDNKQFEEKLDWIKSFTRVTGLAYHNAIVFARHHDFMSQEREEIIAQTQQIEEQSELIAAQSKDILDSMLYAGRIQQTLMPSVSTLQNIFPQSMIYYKPQKFISGDFYWFDRRGTKATIIAADCTGHGIPGALLSFLGITLLNQLISELSVPNAATLLSLLNFRLTCILQPDDAEIQILDGLDAAVCVVDLETNTLEFSGAFLSAIIVRNGEIFQLKGDRKGVSGQAVNDDDDVMLRVYESTTFQLEKGDRVYIGSDGYIDQFGYQADQLKKLGAARLHKLLSALPPSMAMEQVKLQLEMGHLAWRKDQDQTDDMLLIGFEI